MTKGSIYGNFKDKNEVSLEAFKYNFGQLVGRITAYVSRERTAIGQLRAITKFYREDFDLMKYLGGCPVMNAATDSDDTNRQLLKQVNKAFEAIISTIAAIIEKGKADGEIGAKIESAKYAVLFFSMIEGAVLVSKTTGQKTYLVEICERIDHIVDVELVI